MTIIPATCSATPLQVRTFLVRELTQATQRVADVAKQHPSWPNARVRRTVARELDVSTVQLRYMLRKAAEQN